MYLTPTKDHWIVDIETDGLRDECTQIFVVCVENAVTDETFVFRTKEAFADWLDRKYILVGHNLVAFDVPVLNRFWGTRIGISRCVDTFILSMLYSPNLAGGHSLEAWGQRLKFPKLPFKDFTQYSEEMKEYCENDVSLTKRIFNRLTKRMRDVGFSERGASLETYSWHIIQNKQRRHGFPFDYRRALELYTELRKREEELKNEILRHWPPELLPVATYKRATKADGTNTVQFERHMGQYPRVERNEDGQTYTCFDWVEFNLGSPKQRVERLLEAGWEPTSFTKRTEKGGGGNPKVDEDSLLAFAEASGNEGARALAKWVVINSRANMINTWMNAYNEETGAIHGNLWLASTLRYRHDNPNSANIPAVRSTDVGPLRGEEGSWTYEARDLWTCGDRSRYSLVGIDAKGIQLRVLAHYLEDEEFSKNACLDDAHTPNQKMLGLPTRALTKTITYATLMGAGDARIATEANITHKEAKAAKKKFFDKLPGLRRLINRLQNELKRTGRITLCDGSRVLVSSDHMVIPYLLQGDESRIMKQASIYLDQEIRKLKLDAHKVGDIHDEWQFVVLTEQLELFTKTALACFPRAGESFNYRVPIEGDAKEGKTWAQTH